MFAGSWGVKRTQERGAGLVRLAFSELGRHWMDSDMSMA